MRDFNYKMPRCSVLFTLLLCAIVSGLITHQVYRVGFSVSLLENTSFRASLDLQYGGQQNAALPSHEEGTLAKTSFRHINNISENLYVQDVVLLPEDDVLLLIPLPLLDRPVNYIDIFPPTSGLRCIFSDQFSAPVKAIDYLQGRAAIRCRLGNPNWVDFWLKAGGIGTIALSSSDDNIFYPFLAKTLSSRPVKWNSLVYESSVQSDNYDDDLILFAKGINRRQGINTKPRNLRCVFNNTLETAVTVTAQEVFRCKQPAKRLRPALVGAKVTLRSVRKSNRLQLPSVAYYNPHHVIPSFEKESRKFQLCACTMVFNVAKFLKEWIVYHSHLGVQQFFIYDNNSDDNLEEIIKSMADSSSYNVKRHSWPWAKTQEAGFAHCALQARESCHWVMFTDVDEFVFSLRWLNQRPPNSTSNALGLLLMNKTTQMINSNSSASGSPIIGQVSIYCRNFGPSNLKSHPPQGVTQGYTCREKLEQRHKSIVLLEALSPSLRNAIHHFELKPGYKTMRLTFSEAVINHYKYQVWSEFKVKFRRRVSAYVADWKDSKNPSSQDRVPGLGNEAIEPPGWEHEFCEVNDTALREFTHKVFSVTKGPISVMQWQL